MSNKKDHSGGIDFLSIIRYIVGYIERFLENIFLNGQWIFTSSQSAHTQLDAFCVRQFGSAPDKFLKIGIAGVLVFFFWKVMFAFFLVWTAIKSI